MIVRATVDPGAFNSDTDLPYQLRHLDFEGAMQDVYIQAVDPEDFRHNARGELGTRTATLHKLGLQRLRANWVYLLAPASRQRVGPVGSRARTIGR